MKVFPQTSSSDIAEISDFRPGICEGKVDAKDAVGVIKAVTPWLGSKVLQTVVVRPGTEGVMYVQTDSMGDNDGLVRGVTIFDPSQRPENPNEAARFDALMATLGRAARQSDDEVAPGAPASIRRRTAA